MLSEAPDIEAATSRRAANESDPAPHDAHAIWHLPPTEIAAHVGPEMLIRIVETRDWVASAARKIDEPANAIGEVADRLYTIGVPVDRVSVSINTLHTEHDVIS